MAREAWIVFDGPPGPEAGRFVEVEDGRGRGLGPAQTGAAWINRGDGYWELGPFQTPDPKWTPLSVRESGRWSRRRLVWAWKCGRERVAYWLAPWLRGPR